MKTKTNSFQSQIQFLRDKTNQALRSLSLLQEPEYLYDPVRYVLQGKGKRIRPILVHLMGSTYKADPDDLMNAGLAVELLHNFTLVHDDIMDQDDIRHGQPTVHKKWDESTAVLTGDGIYAIAQILMAKVKVNPLLAIQAFNLVTLAVCEGQAYDKEFEHNHRIRLNQYLTMIDKKTGSLIGLCAEIGGILGNQDQETLHRLRSFGLNLGKAFQIQDDIFEIFGNVSAMGKSLGSDLVSGKQTILAVMARKQDPEQWKVFWHDLKLQTLPEAIANLRTYLKDKNILINAKRLAEEYVVLAKEDLSIVPKPRRNPLEQFTEMILNRKR